MDESRLCFQFRLRISLTKFMAKVTYLLLLVKSINFILLSICFMKKCKNATFFAIVEEWQSGYSFAFLSVQIYTVLLYMKSLNNAIRGFIVFGVTAFIFSFLWQDVPGLANAHIVAPRFVFFRGMGIVAIAGLFLGVMTCRRFRFTGLDWAVLVYISYIWTRGMMGDMVDYRIRLSILLVVLYFVFRLLMSVHRRALQIMEAVFMLAVLTEGIYGFCQLYGWAASGHALYRLTGSFFNPGPYSCFLAVGLPVALHRVLVYREKRSMKCRPWHWNMLLIQVNGALAWGCLVVTLLLLPATMSRSAWLAAGVGCMVVGWKQGLRQYFREHIFRTRKKVVLGSVAGCICLCLLSAGAYVLKKDSADGRLLIWKVSLLAMQEHPWQGVGLGHFSGAYAKAQAGWFASGKATAQEENVAGTPEYGFNEYLQTGVELGSIGLLFFLLLIGIALQGVLDSRRKAGVAGGLVCWLVFAWFSYPLSVLPLAVAFVWLLALAGSSLKTGPGRKQGDSVVVACVSLLLTVANVPRDARLRDAYAGWQEEKTYFNMQIYEGTADNYARLYPLLKEEPRFLFEYGQCLSKTGKYEESTRILQEATALSGDPMFYNIMGKNAHAMGHHAQAETYFRQAARILPNRLYPLYLLACLYLDTGQTEKGKETAQQVLQKEPKVMSDAVREMKEKLRNRLGVDE